MKEYQVLDRKNWFADLETKADMNSLAIGVIEEIMGERYAASYAKVIEITRTLRALEEAWDSKKPLLQTEAEEETVHPDCIVNVTKVQSLLDPWYVEQILREKG